MYAGRGRPFSLKSCFFCVVEQDSDEHSIFGVVFSVFYVYICAFVEFRRFVPRWKLAESKPLLLFSSSARSGLSGGS